MYSDANSPSKLDPWVSCDRCGCEFNSYHDGINDVRGCVCGSCLDNPKEEE